MVVGIRVGVGLVGISRYEVISGVLLLIAIGLAIWFG